MKKLNNLHRLIAAHPAEHLPLKRTKRNHMPRRREIPNQNKRSIQGLRYLLMKKSKMSTYQNLFQNLLTKNRPSSPKKGRRKRGRRKS